MSSPLPTALRRIGPYVLENVLGTGGMGVVYRARGPAGPVALKVLRASMTGDDEVRRFRREGQIRIVHPNVALCLDASQDDEGTPYIAFELLDGETLFSRLSRGGLPPLEARRIALAVTAGLGAAHDQGVVHRDLKPANVFLCSDGGVKILDFGVARWGARSTHVTATGAVLGTPTYLSPEQANGDARIDARADVWAVGVLLHEMITGRSPFDRESPLATMLAVLVEEPLPLATVAPHVGVALSRIAQRCLQKPRDERWATARALHEALDACSFDVAAPAELSATAANPAVTLDATVAVPEGEQRLVVVIVAEGVDDAVAASSEAQERGGVVVPIVGNRVVALFGADRWEGDELTRAADAALAVRRHASRVALAAGRVRRTQASGIAGSALSKAEEVLRVPLDGVAVEAESARKLANTHRIEQIEGHVFELRNGHAPGTLESYATTTVTPTRGREAEIAQLRAGVKNVLERSELVSVAVTGPAGIGKTRLKRELERIVADLAEPVRVLAGRCEPLRRETALSAFASSVRGFAEQGARLHGWPRLDAGATLDERLAALFEVARQGGVSAQVVPEVATFLGALVGVESNDPALALARTDPRLIRDRLRLAIFDWFAGLLAQGPVLLALEDLQWADGASLTLLEELLDRFHDKPLFLFVTARPELVERRGDFFERLSLHLQLRGLLPSDVGKMARAILRKNVPDARVRSLADRTAGNPLFVEQLCLAVLEDDRDPDDSNAWPLPVDVQAAVQSRLDHLPQLEKDLCKRASIFGRAFTAPELEAVGMFGASALLASLCRKDLLASRPRAQGGREYTFRSSIAGTVAYDMLAEDLRASLHGLVAEWLEARAYEGHEELARHWELAGRPTAAATHYARAATAAYELGDVERALRTSERALALGVSRTLVVELSVLRSAALELQGDLSAATSALDLAEPSCETILERARVAAARTALTFKSGDMPRAIQLSSNAVELAEAAGDVGMRVVALGRHALLLAYCGSHAEASARLDAVEHLATEARHHALAASWRAQVAGLRGDLGERQAAYERALVLYERLGDVRNAAGTAANLADCYNRVGAYGRAIVSLEEARALCARLGIRAMEGYTLANLGYALAMAGRAPEAESVLREAERIARDKQDAYLGVHASYYFARAKAEQGEWRAAAKLAARTFAEASAAGFDQAAALGAALAARAHLELGELADAERQSQAAMDLLDKRGGLEEDEAEVYLVQAKVLAVAGRTEEAAAIVRRGRTRIMALAEKIGDAERRRDWLYNVRCNRELLTLAPNEP